MIITSLALLTLSALTKAHFHLNYPDWRGDSFATDRSQWLWPCANVSQENSSTNRTAWPLDGGSLVYASSHEWVQTFVNLGLGDAVTGFNISLLAAWNATGNGTVCFPHIGAAELASLNLTEGQTASLQVVNINAEGNALYNCADIVFSANATILSGDACQNSTGIGGYYLTSSASSSSGGESSNASTSTSSAGAAATSKSSGSAGSNRVGVAALVGSAALAVGALIA